MIRENYSPIVKLPSNQQGKDYVVGDLHGCLELLQRLLDAVQFDPAQDRLFSVGDLIDRGPNSMRCLQFLSEPWFYAVKGNHEQMLLDFFQRYITERHLAKLDDDDLTGFLWNGGNWVEEHFLADQQRMTEEFDQGLQWAANLPLLMIVGEDAQRFHVIHAELIKRPFEAEDALWLDSDIDQWLAESSIPDTAAKCLLWARAVMEELEQGPLNRFQPGLSNTFCGHTFGIAPRQAMSHICLDTGAFLSSNLHDYWQDGNFGLTIYDIRENRWLSASYQHDRLIDGKLLL